MLKNLPSTTQELLAWKWESIEPHYKELEDRPLTSSNVNDWLTDWTALSERIDEQYARLYVATTVNTVDKDARQGMNTFLDGIYTLSMAAEEKLKEKLLASRLEPEGFHIPLRNMRAEADLFRQDNLPLLAEQQKLSLEYDKIIGAQTVKWEGEETTLTRLALVFKQPNREKRAKAWQMKAERHLADRNAINELWGKLMDLRGRIAANAGKPSYREYAWMQKLRFDYTPEDCKSFAAAIQEVVVPAASRIYEKRCRQLGLSSLRPWDMIDGWFAYPSPPPGADPLKPFETSAELASRTSAIFHQVDPVLGGYMDETVRSGLTDLENRKNKAPGAYCIGYALIRKPFVFVNAVGTHNDVMTTLHEFGHAFHAYEVAALPFYQQMNTPMEFNEVASMGMELLASPFLTRENGGFYTQAEAARARIEHLETMLLFWPFMAVVDSFQQWVYENPARGADPSACDETWSRLWDRFIPAVDYSGLDEFKRTGWQRKPHIHQVPFYYVEYGLAQLGAVQIFGNARRDQAGALAAYRKALALGSMVTLPELFATANARFAFDAPTLKNAVELMENVVQELEKKL